MLVHLDRSSDDDDNDAQFPLRNTSYGATMYSSDISDNDLELDRKPLLNMAHQGFTQHDSFERSGMDTISYLWIPMATLLLCFMSFLAGVFLVAEDRHKDGIHGISIVWCGYNTLAPILLLYFQLGQPQSCRILRCLMVGSLLMLATGLSAVVLSTDFYDYNDVIAKSLLFYEAQRSGVLPSSNRIPWRGDSALKDVAPSGAPLTGGYYDAGDFIKFGLPSAVSMSLLAWGMIEFQGSFDAIGQSGYMRDTLKWGTDYFIKAHTGQEELIAQVGDADFEHNNWWGRPEDFLKDYTRVGVPVNVTHPGSDIAGSTAAALAASSIVFR